MAVSMNDTKLEAIAGMPVGHAAYLDTDNMPFLVAQLDAIRRQLVTEVYRLRDSERLLAPELVGLIDRLVWEQTNAPLPDRRNVQVVGARQVALYDPTGNWRDVRYLPSGDRLRWSWDQRAVSTLAEIAQMGPL